MLTLRPKKALYPGICALDCMYPGFSFLPPVGTSFSSMSSTLFSSSNYQFIFDAALADYLEQTGVDLTKNPFTEKLQNCRSADDILELLQDKANQFKDYRNGNRKLINCLNPAVQVLHAFSGVLGGVASLVSTPPSSMIYLFYTPVYRCHSNQQMSYFLESTLFLVYVSPLLF